MANSFAAWIIGARMSCGRFRVSAAGYEISALAVPAASISASDRSAPGSMNSGILPRRWSAIEGGNRWWCTSMTVREPAARAVPSAEQAAAAAPIAMNRRRFACIAGMVEKYRPHSGLGLRPDLLAPAVKIVDTVAGHTFVLTGGLVRIETFSTD